MRIVSRRTWIAIAAIILIAGSAFYSYETFLTTAKPERLVLATTTSTFNSGLLDYLRPTFESRYHVKLYIIAVGTGLAIKTAERGDADVVMVHAKPLEEAFLKTGVGIHRIGLMYNDFIIIGPADDPVHIKGIKDPAEAFAKIAEVGKDGKAVFISRADKSGTNVRELSIWGKLGISPGKSAWYVESGTGMGATLEMTEQKGAYTLTDRGTYLAYSGKLPHVQILVQGDVSLLNPYAAILVNPEKFPSVNYRMALAFVKFLISDEGQRLIGEYKKGGEQLFFPIARNVPQAQKLGFPNQAEELSWYDSQNVQLTTNLPYSLISRETSYSDLRVEHGWAFSRTPYSTPSS